MREITIDSARPEDAEHIARFQVLMARESENLELDLSTVREGVKRIFREPWRGFYLVARSAVEPVGCLLVQREWSDWRNREVWWLHSVYVQPDWRRSGVFRQMFRWVEEEAHRTGVAGLRLYVDKGNQVARRVYERLGMRGDHYDLYEKMFQ